jgi:hypothetical protein
MSRVSVVCPLSSVIESKMRLFLRVYDKHSLEVPCGFEIGFE